MSSPQLSKLDETWVQKKTARESQCWVGQELLLSHTKMKTCLQSCLRQFTLAGLFVCSFCLRTDSAQHGIWFCIEPHATPPTKYNLSQGGRLWFINRFAVHILYCENQMPTLTTKGENATAQSDIFLFAWHAQLFPQSSVNPQTEGQHCVHSLLVSHRGLTHEGDFQLWCLRAYRAQTHGCKSWIKSTEAQISSGGLQDFTSVKLKIKSARFCGNWLSGSPF